MNGKKAKMLRRVARVLSAEHPTKHIYKEGLVSCGGERRVFLDLKAGYIKKDN